MRPLLPVLAVLVVTQVACSSRSDGGEGSDTLGLCSADPAERTKPCIDDMGVAMCPSSTRFDGDGFRVCDAETSDRMVLHYGPSDYDDPEQVKLFTLAPGDEQENCTYVRTPNTEEVYIDAYNGRMRPHSHHLIVTMLPEEGFVENPDPAECNLLDVVGAKWLVGSQSPQIDVSVSGFGATSEPKPGDPDYQLAQVVAPRTPVRMNLHYVNPTEETLLREAWVNFSLTDKAHVGSIVDMITLFQGRIDVPANGEFTTARARCVAKSDRYLGLVTGHGHSRMTRETVWHELADGTSKLVYETYDWNEPGNLFYRSSVTNAVPNADARTGGGSSGYELVKAGEALSFECQYKNTTNAAIGLGETTKDEMCNVFGMYYPTNGESWSCGCLGTACVDKLPAGFSLSQIQQ